MKTSTRWILGVVLGLVVVACFATAGLFVFGRMGGFGRLSFERSTLPRDEQRVMPWRDMPMHPFERMPHRGFGAMLRPHWGIAILFLCGLALVGLLVAAATVALVRSSRRQRALGTVPAAAASAVQAADLLAQKACPNCGREVNAEWQHCPYCATSLTSSPPDA